MHLFWWIFWFLVIILLFAVLMPASRRRAQADRESPLQILQRRYAGEISTEEYEEKKKRLEPEHRTSG